MKDPSVENVSKLREQIAVLEGIIREKKEQLRIAEAIEKQKEDLWRKHVAGRRRNRWKMNSRCGNRKRNEMAGQRQKKKNTQSSVDIGNPEPDRRYFLEASV